MLGFVHFVEFTVAACVVTLGCCRGAGAADGQNGGRVASTRKNGEGAAARLFGIHVIGYRVAKALRRRSLLSHSVTKAGQSSCKSEVFPQPDRRTTFPLVAICREICASRTLRPNGRIRRQDCIAAADLGCQGVSLPANLSSSLPGSSSAGLLFFQTICVG